MYRARAHTIDRLILGERHYNTADSFQVALLCSDIISQEMCLSQCTVHKAPPRCVCDRHTVLANHGTKDGSDVGNAALSH